MGRAERRLTPAWWILRAVAVLVVRVLGRWRVRVVGLEHVPTEGGAVLVFNHHSHFDFVMVGYDIVRKLRRPVRFLAKREIWSSPWTGWVVRVAGAVPVDRDAATGRHGAFDEATRRLRDGALVAVAPEQTISPSFELLPFRTGAVRMAQAAGVPLVPVIGWGTQRFLGNGRAHFVRRLPVEVHYGPPIFVGPSQDPVEVTNALRDEMAIMLDRVQRAYPEAPKPNDDWWQPARLGGSAPNHEAVLAEHAKRFRSSPDGGT